MLWRGTLVSVVLLPVSSLDEPFALAATGPELWELLAEPRTLDDLVDHLTQRHGADPATVAADVAPLLERLLELGALAAV